MKGTAAAFLVPLVAWAWLPATYAWSRPEEQQALLPPLSVDGASSEHGATSLQFSLRHIYHAGSHKYPGLLRKVDIKPDTILAYGDDNVAGIGPGTVYGVQTRPTRIERMVDRSHKTVNSILEAGRMTGQSAYLPPEAWTVDEIPGPNITDKETVLSFAQMAANAYILTPGTDDWQDIKEGGFNYTEDFGWQEDGLRGHIFADTENKTVVIALKGTSMAIFDGAETTGHDKTNDNLFGSCCCGQGGPFTWKRVCDCMSSAYTCNNTCLTKSLREKSHYYHAAKDLYANVTERYPNADVWMTGHSLGGVVTALLGLTYGLPVVTFEAFPDALAAGRLGLPTPPGYRIGRHQDRKNAAVHHFGHTADPIFMGTCNGPTASCAIAGYALESYCHTGSVCTYDTVTDLGWRSGVGTHRIVSVIHDVIKPYDTVPSCDIVEDCVDCYNWKFFESNGTERTTTSPTHTSTSKTSTRTETCKTPGWWGCLDETTSSKTTETSTVTTTTCLRPGWFGCKKEATTTYTTTFITSVPAPAPTITTIPESSTTASRTRSTVTSTTCTSPGWFGCNDPNPTTTTSSTTKVKSTKTKKHTTTTTCTNKEWFGLICVDPSPEVTP